MLDSSVRLRLGNVSIISIISKSCSLVTIWPQNFSADIEKRDVGAGKQCSSDLGYGDALREIHIVDVLTFVE